MSAISRLIDHYLQDLPAGALNWIGLRPQRRADMKVVSSVRALAELGLEGDRRCNGTPGSARQVTLISQEHIAVIATLMGRDSIPPELLRRNLVISGINLMALRHQRFRIGGAEFEGAASCHPCGRMEEALGKGGFAAMYGHGGLCARILVSGDISVGDPVIKL